MNPDPPPTLLPEQLARNLAARRNLLLEFGFLTSDELSSRGLASHVGLLSVPDPVRGAVYPEFQFAADGSLRPVVGMVIEALRPLGPTDWQIALWFTTASGWLGDRRPVDLLDESPDLVARAARQLTEDPPY